MNLTDQMSAFGLTLSRDDEAAWPLPRSYDPESQPEALYVAGNSDDLGGRMARSVFITGSRSCTAYGSGVASEFAAAAAKGGCTLVSTGAFGVETAAIRGALAARGDVIVVQPCQRAYPTANTDLLAAVRGAGGTVMSATEADFPTRERFVTARHVAVGISRGTILVEAAQRSGASDAATQAMRWRKPLGAVPGPITSATSRVPNLLIGTDAASIASEANLLEFLAIVTH